MSDLAVIVLLTDPVCLRFAVYISPSRPFQDSASLSVCTPCSINLKDGEEERGPNTSVLIHLQRLEVLSSARSLRWLSLCRDHIPIILQARAQAASSLDMHAGSVIVQLSRTYALSTVAMYWTHVRQLGPS